MAELADLILAGASIAVAIALVVVTRYLVQQTKQLARATEGLQGIERRRERTEARRRQVSRLRRKIELTQHVLSWQLEAWKHNYLVKGDCPPEGYELKELAELLEYGKDHANRELVEEIVRTFDLLIQGQKMEGVPADNFVDNVGHLKKLREDIPRWEAELMALDVEETASIDESMRE